MNPRAIAEDESESDLPAPAYQRHVVNVLTGIYLDAGLPLEWAVRAALADWECCFEGEVFSRS